MSKTEPQPSAWSNRIVGHGEADPRELIPHPSNWRKHPPLQRQAIRGSLNEVGWVEEVMVNRVTGNLVDGHARVEEAIRDGAATVPVRYVELTEAEEELILATLDPIGALALRNEEQLSALLAGVSTSDDALRELLSSLDLSAPLMTAAERTAEWDGMPGLELEDQSAWKQVLVSFRSPEDLKAFAKLVGQENMTVQTRSIWWPPQERWDRKQERYAPAE